MEVEEVLFDVAEALLVPVLVGMLLALALVLFEFGGLVAELIRRRGRSRVKLDQAIASAGAALSAGDSGRAYLELGKIANSKSMRGVMGSIVEHRSATNGADRIAKDLAEFDYSLGSPARAHPHPRSRRSRAGTDGNADPALTGSRRSRRGRRRDACRQSSRRLQRHGRRPLGRRDCIRHLARARPPLRPGFLRPRVHRRGAGARRDSPATDCHVDADRGARRGFADRSLAGGSVSRSAYETRRFATHRCTRAGHAGNSGRPGGSRRRPHNRRHLPSPLQPQPPAPEQPGTQPGGGT